MDVAHLPVTAGKAPDWIADPVSLMSLYKEVKLDPGALARFTGGYKGRTSPSLLVAVEGGRLTGGIGNIPPVEMTAESETKFYLKTGFEIEFPAGSQPAAQATIRQMGRDMVAPRMSDEEYNRARDSAAAFARRLKDQTAVPGGQAALTKLIAGLHAGTPVDDVLSPDGIGRQEQDRLRQQVSAFGAVQSITFQSVFPTGGDIYTVKAENGTWEWHIWVSAEGKIQAASMRPVQ
jgi:hypothetical protein